MSRCIAVKRPDESTDVYELVVHSEPMTTVINNDAGGQRVVVPMAALEECLNRPYNSFSRDPYARTTNCMFVGIGEFETVDATMSFPTDTMGYEILEDVI